MYEEPLFLIVFMQPDLFNFYDKMTQDFWAKISQVTWDLPIKAQRLKYCKNFFFFSFMHISTQAKELYTKAFLCPSIQVWTPGFFHSSSYLPGCVFFFHYLFSPVQFCFWLFPSVLFCGQTIVETTQGNSYSVQEEHANTHTWITFIFVK